MRTTITVSVALAILALLVVTKGTTETTKSPIQSEMSIYDLHVGYNNMKDLPVQEAPLP
jgi:hypothetical protein